VIPTNDSPTMPFALPAILSAAESPVTHASHERRDPMHRGIALSLWLRSLVPHALGALQDEQRCLLSDGSPRPPTLRNLLLTDLLPGQ
jgi:hypothetical protein